MPSTILDKINTFFSRKVIVFQVLTISLKQKGRSTNEAPIIRKDATTNEGASIKRKMIEERPREKMPRIKIKGK